MRLMAVRRRAFVRLSLFSGAFSTVLQYRITVLKCPASSSDVAICALGFEFLFMWLESSVALSFPSVIQHAM